MSKKHKSAHFFARILLLAVLLLVEIGTLCSCGDSEEQKERNRACMAQAAENAIHYIEQKYGFTPIVTDTIIERVGNIFGSSPLTKVLVTMTHDGQTFYAYIDGKDANTAGTDNYQLPAILDGIRARLPEALSPDYKLTITGGYSYQHEPLYRKCRQLFSVYYTGDNLPDVLGAASYHINLRCAGVDSESIGDLTKKGRTTITCISYRSAKSMAQCTRSEPDAKHAIHIDSFAKVANGKVQYKTYPLSQCGKFSYYVESEYLCNVNITPTTLPDPSNWNRCKAKDGMFVSDAYRITCTAPCTIYLFYPQSKIPIRSTYIYLALYQETEDGARFTENRRSRWDLGSHWMQNIYMNPTPTGENRTTSFALLLPD